MPRVVTHSFPFLILILILLGLADDPSSPAAPPPDPGVIGARDPRCCRYPRHWNHCYECCPGYNTCMVCCEHFSCMDRAYCEAGCADEFLHL